MPIVRHIKIKGKAKLFDPKYKGYFLIREKCQRTKKAFPKTPTAESSNRLGRLEPCDGKLSHARFLGDSPAAMLVGYPTQRCQNSLEGTPQGGIIPSPMNK